MHVGFYLLLFSGERWTGRGHDGADKGRLLITGESQPPCAAPLRKARPLVEATDWGRKGRDGLYIFVVG